MTVLKIILVLLAVLCGLALIFAIPTGTLKPIALGGIGIICVALAVVAP